MAIAIDWSDEAKRDLRAIPRDIALQILYCLTPYIDTRNGDVKKLQRRSPASVYAAASTASSSIPSMMTAFTSAPSNTAATPTANIVRLAESLGVSASVNGTQAG